ncbi:MMPL family transporter [uncultured Arcobacter sp.]|uniref:efflux RND transporter permease subunit n=1 Tax=uncultured Arcobacter sp. TaxID=165434 RepID=UPI0026346CDA|nr:MMPL family transporter [uncultured Arcobacter sp.]
MKSFFDRFIINSPKRVLLGLFIIIAVLGYFSTKLEIDASSQTLMLENDKDLKLTRQINKRYNNSDILVLTLTPKDDLLSQKTIDLIKAISSDLENLSRVESVTSILTVPMLQSPVRQIKDLVDKVYLLEDKEVDKKLAKKEFLTSPLYKNALVSADFKTTSLVINLARDNKYFEFIEKRNSLIQKQRDGSISKVEEEQLETLKTEFKTYRDRLRELEHQNILKVRAIIKKYENEATLFLGGVTMIADDIITFVKNDLLIYGSSLVLILIIVLWLIFRQVVWITLPILICTLSVVATSGLLGLFAWEITVISSNFIALQLIITISIVLHLIVRYRELSGKFKHASQYKLVINTVLSKINPSFFAIITTIAGFGSLVFSGIHPVINLGWMMSAGIAMSLLISFIIFPAVMIMSEIKRPHKQLQNNSSLTSLTSYIVEKKPKYIFIATGIIILFSISGTMKLKVENSFINYFKKDTQIYKGMEVIDKKLGGTTPLDIIIDFKVEKDKKEESSSDEFSFEDEFQATSNDAQYWFTQDKMDLIMKVHNYLESLDSVGNVQSLATLLKIGKTLNNDVNLDGFKLALLYNKLPPKYKDLILSPYINIENNQARFNVRIIDSNPNLRRNDFLLKIKNDLAQIVPSSVASYKLTNLMVLYNNMLQSLFDSQIKTLGFVVGILLLMFIILFRSLKIAFIAIITNIVPIGIVFGIMGWLEIPLDIMTITIAAISIGIGVDDTIHYIHRFKEEYRKDHDYVQAMKRSHSSIGYAMYYTTLAVVLGFSILVLSNLIPTIYFGILTVIVMITILSSALLLLPRLLIIFKPYNK